MFFSSSYSMSDKIPDRYKGHPLVLYVDPSKLSAEARTVIELGDSLSERLVSNGGLMLEGVVLELHDHFVRFQRSKKRCGDRVVPIPYLAITRYREPE